MFYSIVIDTTDFLDRQKKRSATEILQKHFFFSLQKTKQNKSKIKQTSTKKMQREKRVKNIWPFFNIMKERVKVKTFFFIFSAMNSQQESNKSIIYFQK